MTRWSPYQGEHYLSWSQIEDWCRDTAAACPDWVSLTTVGETREGRPILFLKIGLQDAHIDDRPGFWLDAGTHAAEWTSVMSALYTVSRWVEGLRAGHASEDTFFRAHTAYVMPCIAPDGYHALMDGAPFIRSTLRPDPSGAPRIGFAPQDLTGDGGVRWMRWKHPAGGFVPDDDEPMFMRPRQLKDRPEDAYFFCLEGQFLNWDGARWTQAAREFGIDLNRNFPAHWAPFTMFGMDGGIFSLSEPESRAVVDTFSAYPRIGAAVTNHTYTGCILTQPYREDTPLPDGDVLLMERIAQQAVEGTGYRVFRTYPDFAYDKKTSIVGVWSDTLSTVFGVPGYTLELWDPFEHAGVQIEKPAEFFTTPDPELIRQVISAFGKDPKNCQPWVSFEHPQLGPVEIGGIDYMRTVRNPPDALLAEECRKGHAIAQSVRSALPKVQATVEVTPEGTLTHLRLVMENLGFTSTSGLAHGAKLPVTPAVSAALDCQGGCSLVHGAAEQTLEHMNGWGSASPGGPHSVYPSLPAQGHRSIADWWVRGGGTAVVRWSGGRGGAGVIELQV